MAADISPPIPQNGNDVVRVRELYAALREQSIETSDERKAMEERLTKKIEKIQDCMPTVASIVAAQDRADKAHGRIDDLWKINIGWNGLNSLGAIIAGILGVK